LGERDSITQKSQALHLRELIPDAKLMMIAKAGHIPQIEEPELFAGALVAALYRNPSDATR
jgi:pimeloyl-ACP methyl ester carboxylesterase